MKQDHALILLTRPKAQSQRFAAQITEVLTPVPSVLIAPLVEITPLDWPAGATQADYVIFTSQNAIQFRAIPQDQPAYCVGPRTRTKAAAMGYRVVSEAATVAELIQKLAKIRPAGQGLYLRGTETRQDLIKDAALAGLSLQEQIVYRQSDHPWSPEIAGQIAAQPLIVAPLFSPRSAQRFVQALQGRKTGVTCIGLSAAVIAVLPLALKDRSICSAEPTAFHMVQEINALFAAGALLERRDPAG